MNDQLIQNLGQYLELAIPSTNDREALRYFIADHINQLIETDFHRLISLLYRIDVNEEKLKKLLKDNEKADAGLIIADLIIERQLEKIKSREQFKQKDNDKGEDEKW
jgi:hypothetical protein